MTSKIDNNHVVIMAGGVGSRFWPLSTPEYPKQFIDILGCGKSLLQMTVERFAGICAPENIWIVTNKSYTNIINDQLPHINSDHILSEPVPRNTAPCIAWACWLILKKHNDANIIVTPADSVIVNIDIFKRILLESLNFIADRDVIVTIGIKISRPETGYGYIEVSDCASNSIIPVREFKEKPSMEIAETYYNDGKHLWNAGIFIGNAKTISSLIMLYKPEIGKNVLEMIDLGDIDRIFPTFERISIDYAVLEPASIDGKVFTIPADIGWCDLGNWTSLHDKIEKDNQNNISVGNVKLIDSTNCIIHAQDTRRIIVQGMDGYIVAVKDGMILICKRENEQYIGSYSCQ